MNLFETKISLRHAIIAFVIRNPQIWNMQLWNMVSFMLHIPQQEYILTALMKLLHIISRFVLMAHNSHSIDIFHVDIAIIIN